MRHKVKEINTQEEYEAVMDQVDAMIKQQPEPGSKIGKEIDRMIALAEDFEKRNEPPRVTGWVCPRCHRTWSPEMLVCGWCEDHFGMDCEELHEAHCEAVAQHQDNILKCDANFVGQKGC